MSAFLNYNNDFEIFNNQHITVLAIMIVMSVALPSLAKRFLDSNWQLRLSRIMAISIAFWDLLYLFLLWWLGDFNYRTDLPLDVCNVVAIFLPFLMWNPNFRIHEIIYFWILAGTFQAVITPHLFNGYPNFIFWKYWIVHCGLVIYAIYVTVVFDLKPNTKSIWRSFIMMQFYALVVLLINLTLDSNYVYLLRKPPTASILDYFGPWPWYIFVSELIGLALFFLVYLPVWWFGRKAEPAQIGLV